MIATPPGRGGVGAAAARAGALGLGIAALVAVLGQLVAFALYLAVGARGSFTPYARIGALYLALFHRVAVTASVSARIRPAAVSGGGLELRLGLGLLTAAAVAVVLLAAAARATAGRLEPRLPVRVAVAAVLATAYALPVFGLSVLSDGAVPIRVGAAVDARLSVGVVAWQALALPGAIALWSAIGGALLDAHLLGRAAGVVLGGVRAFALALVLAFVGLLVLATLEPSSTRAYLSAVSSPSPMGTAALVGHHVLVLPNQSMWVLVPAMGGCDVATFGAGTSSFLCYGRAPSAVELDLGSLSARSGNPVRFAPLPAAYLAFVLVPLLACVAGGHRAARGEDRPAVAAALGAASGPVFALLVLAGCGLSSIGLTASTDLLGSATTVRAMLGPDPISGTLLALVWGVGAGALGGLARAYGVGVGSMAE